MNDPMWSTMTPVPPGPLDDDDKEAMSLSTHFHDMGGFDNFPTPPYEDPGEVNLLDDVTKHAYLQIEDAFKDDRGVLDDFFKENEDAVRGVDGRSAVAVAAMTVICFTTMDPAETRAAASLPVEKSLESPASAREDGSAGKDPGQTRGRARRSNVTAGSAANQPPGRAGRARQTTAKAKTRLPAANGPVECDLCGTVFKKREYLQKHMNSKHKNKKPKCQNCGADFSEKTDLNRHMKTVHGLNPKGELLDEEKTRCDFPGCAYQTYRSDKLGTHMKSKHRGEAVLRCRLTRGEENPSPCKFTCYTERRRKQHEKRTTAGHTRNSPRPRRLSGTPDE